jgi:uncharacterized membrane protein
MQNRRTQIVAHSAVFTALTFVVTFFTSIPLPFGGIVNMGDAVIFITAFVAGPIPAMIAGGLGSALVNLAGRPAVIWAPFTLVIKGGYGLVAGLLFKAFREKAVTTDPDLPPPPAKLNRRTVLAMLLAAFAGSVIMISGYFFSRWGLAYLGFIPTDGNTAIYVAAFWMLPNTIQMAVSAAVAVPTSIALRKILKNHAF